MASAWGMTTRAYLASTYTCTHSHMWTHIRTKTECERFFKYSHPVKIIISEAFHIHAVLIFRLHIKKKMLTVSYAWPTMNWNWQMYHTHWVAATSFISSPKHIYKGLPQEAHSLIKISEINEQQLKYGYYIVVTMAIPRKPLTPSNREGNRPSNVFQEKYTVTIFT